MQNLKALEEKRAELQGEMESLVNSADTEQRAMSEDEIAKFDAAEKAIREIDATIEREERARNMEKKEVKVEVETRTDDAIFADHIRAAVEKRAGEKNIDMGSNGAIIPTSIANRIITTIKERCPILEKTTLFSVKGTLKIPVYGASSSHDIAVGYQEEFTDITADSGAFTSVDLTGFLAGALTLIGKSVINNSDIAVVNFIVAEMGRQIALFLEKELINGTSEKAEGAISTTTTLNAGSISAISADNLIELQAKIPTAYQGNSCWVMAPATFTAIRKLKDGNGQYLLQNNFSQDFPYAILGKPVYLSDNMPTIALAAKAVLYGDFSGMGVNFRENIEVQILNEKYATQHAVGIVSWFEFDCDVIDNQKIASLVMSAD